MEGEGGGVVGRPGDEDLISLLPDAEPRRAGRHIKPCQENVRASGAPHREGIERAWIALKITSQITVARRIGRDDWRVGR